MTEKSNSVEERGLYERYVLEANQYLMPSLLHQYYREPLLIERGTMEYLYDVHGEEYLDCFSGIVVVNSGHCNLEITEKVIDQLKQLQHVSTCYLHKPMVDLARKLAEITPDPLQKSFFVTSGSEAIDGALLLARKYTKKREIIALRHSYHGRSLLANAVTATSTWKKIGATIEGIHFAPNPYCYRCLFNLTYPSCSLHCVQALEEVIKDVCGGEVAAVLIEVVQGIGGYIVPPPGYFQRVREVVDSYDALLIIDEVQTGFGRIGHMFGSDVFRIEPDIMVLAKGFGNGIPIAAFIGRVEVADAIEGPWISTFGGNPVSCVGALSHLEYLEKNNIPATAREVGEYLKRGLEELALQFDSIGDVRGEGLMLALELVKDRETKEPAIEETALALERMREERILLGKAGAYNNVLRIGPPLTLSLSQAKRVLFSLEKVFKGLT